MSEPGANPGEDPGASPENPPASGGITLIGVFHGLIKLKSVERDVWVMVAETICEGEAGDMQNPPRKYIRGSIETARYYVDLPAGKDPTALESSFEFISEVDDTVIPWVDGAWNVDPDIATRWWINILLGVDPIIFNNDGPWKVRFRYIDPPEEPIVGVQILEIID